MDKFERTWRNKIIKHTFLQTDTEITDKIIDITENDPITYTKILIKRLKNMTVDEKIKHIFIQSACHLPHNKLDEAKKVYEKTKSIEKARDVLEQSFKIDIKEYKNLSDQQVDEIIELGWGLPGLFNEGDIIATKIPSMFHEYLNETDELKKKYYYCQYLF